MINTKELIMSNIISQLDSDEEEVLIGTLVSLTRQKHFRAAWDYLTSNVPPNSTRIKDAGIVLQDLSNHYGDIGNLKDDCLLRKELEQKVERVVALLV